MMFVSHKLEEVLEIADLITVFRDGRVAASGPRQQFDKRDLVRAMIGRDLTPEPPPRRPTTAAAAIAVPALAARGVGVPGMLHNIDIDVARGEVVGLGGLVGSGRTSLLRALAGLQPHSHGALSMAGKRVPWPRTPRQALRAGISLVPEDRKLQGLVLSMTGTDNITMTDYAQVAWLGVLSSAGMLRRASEVARRFGFDENRLGGIVRNLSGGNQQKILLAKWGYRPPKVLLVDEPTRGIDIGAKQEILATLRQMAEQGLGIVIVSSELEEVVTACDRVLVMAEGRVVGKLDHGVAPIQVQDILHAVFKVTQQ
jgi:ABC-type sugar transport system ATPase subunit